MLASAMKNPDNSANRDRISVLVKHGSESAPARNDTHKDWLNCAGDVRDFVHNGSLAFFQQIRKISFSSGPQLLPELVIVLCILR